MILVDMNQVSIATIMAESKGKPDYDENLIRHMVLNNLRIMRNKFKNQYGEMVLCYDDFSSWRRKIFEHYKANRKQTREASAVDWKKLFDFLTLLREELKEYFPYKVINVKDAEADDIIAILARNQTTPTLIISSDYDFIQLQTNPNIKQHWAVS